jgi:hypothetical protein
MLQKEGSSSDRQSRKIGIKIFCDLENTKGISFRFFAKNVQTLAHCRCSHILTRTVLSFYAKNKSSSP